ncbi:hypothetical protein XENOCAPTIV_026820, partial [Xenoophorus captivus]
AYGKIIYLLEAILSRSMRMDSKESTVINFVGKGDLNPVPGLMIKPKYCIYRKHSFFAKRKRKVHTMDLLKKVGKPIPPSASENVAQVIAIPQDAEPSILNCDIIKAEHRLRVYLDVKYNSDPEIKFNIVILPPYQVPAMSTAPSAASDFGNGPYGNYRNPHPLVWGFGPPQPPAGDQPAVPPPPYETYAMYPSLNDFASKC